MMAEGMLALVKVGGAHETAAELAEGYMAGRYTILWRDEVNGPHDYATVIKILGDDAMISPREARELLRDAWRTGRREWEA